ncbi:LOW QUALITY PROTEIN: protostome-specific GEF [Aphomia sociella]
MLKWAVYGKKNQEVKSNNEIEIGDRDSYTNGPYNNNIRRSLDAQSVKKSKKPSRYQRRSLGSAAIKKNNIKTVDKENVNYIGSTPNYFKEGFKKPEGIALKDVSNITPTSGTPVKNFERRRYYLNGSKDDIPPDLPPTPPTYSRRVREEKRKLEMTSNTNNDAFRRDSCVYKSERRIKPIDRSNFSSPILSHSTSEPSLNDLSDRLNATTNSSRKSFVTGKHVNNNIICTTKPPTEGLVEIEYDKDLVINCIEKPISPEKPVIEKITLPIFGHNIFMDNPLYFNKSDTNISNIRPLKRTRKKSNEFESSFKSPSVDKKDAHILLREGCSPVSITPLSVKFAALRFSTMSTHSKSQRPIFSNEVTEYFPKVEHPFTIPLRDEESCTEMENKFILCKDSTTNTTGSTVSTTQMGDVTLEKMIEDIIKSTKIVKTRRRIINQIPDSSAVEEEIPPLDAVRDLFVNPQANNKVSLIKEAKYVNLSRENSISPKSTPTKKILPVHRVNEKLLKNLPIGCFILDDGDGYNEREVRTPDDVIEVRSRIKSTDRVNKSVNRSHSLKSSSFDKSNLESSLSESTPDLYTATQENTNIRLRRQRCIRRKKSTVSNESQWKKDSDVKTSSFLTLEMGIPSPVVELQNVSLCQPLSISLDCVAPSCNKDEQLHTNNSIQSNVSHSSLKSHEPVLRSRRSREIFGLTLENGIPSPITPVTNLKRTSNVLSEERAHKTSKLDEELFPSEAFTPVIEHKSSRRCLTYSPEESSINSSEEKRRSVASNRLERSSDRLQLLKGTIDLEIITKNDIIDVHVIRCRDLQRSSGKTDEINAYAKVVISGVTESQALSSQRSIFQRTSVLYGKREPEFQRHLKLPLPTAVYDHQLLHVSVWHRDKKYRRSEFLGCVSFPLKDALNSDITGTYFLQGTGRQGAPAHANDRGRDDRVTEGQRKMATDNIESTNDGTKENHTDKGVATNGPSSATTANQAQTVAAALQREADEHLFLRYLELDPPEDPAAPRKAPRNGRTPFTTTRKLVRGTGGGFGFTVVWTRPPRVERVAAGGSAERAGLRAGDYIVFVGTKNVVTATEEDVRGLVKSAGQMLTIETFRRVPQNGSGVRARLTQVNIPPESTPPPPPRSPRAAALASPATAARPPTACSSTSQSLDRRKLHLPQVTFSKEDFHQQTPGLSADGRKRALLAVVAREQHYATCLQFGLVRFVSPLAERADLIAPNDHQLLFQNIEEIFRLSEDILDQIVQDDSEIQTSTVVAVYLQKTPVFLSLYKKYCLGLKRADCVLVKKSKDPSGAFSRFCTSPPIPRRRPDITSLVHKPLEQFRELLRLMRTAAAAGGAGPYDQLEKKQLQVIVEQLQSGYQDVTAGSGLMGLAGDGKPLLSVADLESRLVFTRCKPFVLSTPGRQWIFGGELSRVEGRAVRPYWALLFSDLLLFATVSRDRVLFVTEEPVALATVSDAQFNVRKKATEFRLVLGRAGGESPLVSCAPRTPGRTRTVVLRAPSIDLKAVWQSLLQRQIYRAHTMTGTPLGSPLDSPDPQLTFSLATLDSQQRQTRRSSAETQTGAGGSATEGARSTRSRGSTLHLQRWMTQLPEAEEMDPPEPDMEMWSVEELRKRSKELNLLEVADLVIKNNDSKGPPPGEKKEHDRSPSKSSNSGSQITVRTSPVVVDTIPVCRQCHKKCLSKPNSPLVSQKEPSLLTKQKTTPSPQNSNSNKSSNSACSANCANRKPRNFSHLERKGAMKLRPEDAPMAALKVIDSIEQSQKMLKSTSYELKTDSPILNRSTASVHSRNQTKSHLELRKESYRSPSPSSSSRNNSPLSTSHTTCSSMVFNSSSNDLRMSNSNIANQVQCVIAQEKYLNEVKCVESITLSKSRGLTTNYPSPASARKEQITRQKAENVLNKVLGMNIITKRENVGTCLKTSSVFLSDDSIHEDDNDFKIERGIRRSPKMGISAVSKMNGDINKKTEKTEDMNANINANDLGSDDDLELGPLMLMGLSAINPAAHLMRVEPFKRSSLSSVNNVSRPGSLGSVKSESPVPNIAVVPPTPDYNTSNNKTDTFIDDSPDSPDVPDDLPYVSLKRYGTMSSLERLPSDETDDGNVRLTPQESETTKVYNPVSGAAGGIMGWTARAGSFVVEKMNIFSYTESVPNTSIAHKQPSFLERCLGVSDWKSPLGTEEGTAETGEGSGASGEEAWGTPSSGDLSDNLADSDHGTLSSPTKSSSSYAGDDDTELMMDELLMAPTITGPTTLRPLLPRDVFRRRLEPLLEEDCSDSGSEDNKQTPTNSDDQGSAHGLDADDCCDAPHLPPSASELEAGGGGAAAAQTVGEEHDGGDTSELSPERTPTNEVPSMPLQSVSKECVEVRAAVGAGRRGSASSASTPSTLERTTIHNPTHNQMSLASEPAAPEVSSQPEEQQQIPERLSPRAEMRLALDQGKDMLADQEVSWDGGCDPWSFRAACQKSLLRRVASADAVTLCRALPRRTAPHTTSRNSVYAWKLPESEKLMEMEQLARAEVQTMRSRTRSLCQNGKIMGFLRRRASSDSPRRTPLFPTLEGAGGTGAGGAGRPFSPRRTTEKQFEKRFWKQVTRRRQSCGSISQI